MLSIYFLKMYSKPRISQTQVDWGHLSELGEDPT